MKSSLDKLKRLFASNLWMAMLFFVIVCSIIFSALDYFVFNDFSARSITRAIFWGAICGYFNHKTALKWVNSQEKANEE